MSVDTQTIDNTPGMPVPTVEDLKTVVIRQLNAWSATTVGGLCVSQTQTLINNLSPYYHSGEKDAVPEVTNFKEVFHDFQQKHERVAFADLNDSEISELILEVAPLFHDSEKKSEDEEDESGAIDKHSL